MKDNNVYEFYEKKFEYSSSSEFESCSSDLTDDCTSTLFEEEEEELYPPITLDFHESLSYHILKQYQRLLPLKLSFNKRQLMALKVQKLLNEECPNQKINVYLFGSSQNLTGTNHSDVDICISTLWNELISTKTLAYILKKNGLHVLKTIPRAKVPIVKIWDPTLQLACDINVNNTLALQNTRMIKTYVSIDPRVRPLIIIVKHWAKQRKLNDAGNGGTLSSYTWTCMIIHFLQTRYPPILPALHQIPHRLSRDNVQIGGHNSSFCEDLHQLRGFGKHNYESLGGLLYAFFRKFAYEFDYQNQVISVRSGRILSREEKGWHQGIERSHWLCIEEPFDTSRNLGNSANTSAVKGLILEFQRACHVLLETRGNLDVLCQSYKSFF